MPALQVVPPNAENEALLAQIPGLRQTAIPVIAFDGPEGHRGPEAAGALLFLHMTMVDPERAQTFWSWVARTCQEAARFPGFIRAIAFWDGLTNNLVAFWRTLEDAQAYAYQPGVHLEAIQAMKAQQFEYTHFAGLFVPVRARPREFYCERCGAEAHLPVAACPACGNPVTDVYALQAMQG
jgi:hypothetical protein